MSSTITYKGNTLTTVNNQTKILNTRGTWLEDNITITDATSSGGGTPAISVVDTLDAKGGTVRTITALDISDTTAVASDVAVGKYFYTANGTKTAGANSGGGAPSATAHTIYFEFTDNTNTTITAYYDDSFISSAITATTPVTYGQKTVDSASLDGVEWYANVGYEVLYNNSIELDSYDSSLYGSWLGRVADTEAEDGSEWRVTINGTVYNCLAVNDSLDVSGDGSWSIRLDGLGGGQCMFYYTNPPSPNITLKIERKVTA